MDCAGGVAGASGPKYKRINLDVDPQNAVIAEILRSSADGAPKKGLFTRVEALFKTIRWTIERSWKATSWRRPRARLALTCAARHLESMRAAIREISLKNRTTRRTFSSVVGIPRSTLFDNLERIGLCSSGCYLKPLLKKNRKLEHWHW